MDDFLTTDKPLFLAYIIDEVNLGEPYPRHYWPLHISFVPWFVSDRREELDKTLVGLIGSIEPFEVQVGGEEMFGEAKNAHVNVLVSNQQALSLHLSLLNEVVKSSTIIDDVQYVRENYRAHINHYSDRHKKPGEIIKIDRIYLSELTDDDHTTPIKCYEMQA
jgi:hypothetical protein